MLGARLVISFFFILLPAVFIGIGATQVWRQQQKIETYVAVEAVVDSSAVETRRRKKSTSYSPVVKYHYEVRGRVYNAGDVLPVDMNSGKDWAHEVVSRYPAGARTTAYHDPVEPSRAFLVREYSFTPYMFCLFPMIHLSIGVAMVYGTKWLRPTKSAQAPRTSRQPGWFELLPRESIGQKLRTWTVMTALWFGVGIIAIGHFFIHASSPYGSLALIGPLAYAALGALPAGMWVYYLLLMRRTTDAIVMSGAQRFTPGQAFAVRVVQSVHDDTSIESLRVGVVCDKHVKYQSGGKTRYNTVIECEEWTTLVENHEARAGETIDRTATLMIPSGRAGTSVSGDYPRYEWKVEVKSALRNSPDYRGEFPIHVERPATVS
jgi:hypothetical protein